MFIAHQTKFVLFIILEFGTRTIFLFIVHALKFILLIILVNIYDVQFRSKESFLSLFLESSSMRKWR